MPDEPVEIASPEEQRRRDLRWLTWLALAVLLLVVLWLLRDYLVRSSSTADVGTVTTTSSEIPVTSATVEYESEEATEAAEERSSVGVPDVVGLMTSDAVGTLNRAGYEAAVTKVFSDTKPTGVVFEQVPAAGGAADQGSTVRVLVSGGEQPPRSVRVPNVVGMKKNAAVSKLDGLGLDPKVMVQPRYKNVGRVFEQSPAPGTKVVSGSKVFVLVASSY